MTQAYPLGWEQSKCEFVGMVERGGSGAQHGAEMGAASFPPSFPSCGWARDVLRTSPSPHCLQDSWVRAFCTHLALQNLTDELTDLACLDASAGQPHRSPHVYA